MDYYDKLQDDVTKRWLARRLVVLAWCAYLSWNNLDPFVRMLLPESQRLVVTNLCVLASIAWEEWGNIPIPAPDTEEARASNAPLN